jgi:3-dehydroquinate dehydratase-2
LESEKQFGIVRQPCYPNRLYFAVAKGSMTQKVLLVNGPNLNLLGTREPEIYGSTTLLEIETSIVQFFENAEIECLHLQSNHEGQLIDFLHAHQDANFMLLNPGAFTHTSVALRDAISGTQIPFVEIHISNVHSREDFRKHSYFTDVAVGVIAGLGARGYQLAAEFALEYLKVNTPRGES